MDIETARRVFAHAGPVDPCSCDAASVEHFVTVVPNTTVRVCWSADDVAREIVVHRIRSSDVN